MLVLEVDQSEGKAPLADKFGDDLELHVHRKHDPAFKLLGDTATRPHAVLLALVLGSLAVVGEVDLYVCTERLRRLWLSLVEEVCYF